MKTREFIVPTEAIIAIAEKLSENELTNEITGTTEDDEIIIEVQYEKEDRQTIFEMEEIIDDCQEDEEDDD